MLALSFAAQDMNFIYCSNYWPSAGIVLDYTCKKCKKSQFGTKFLEIKEVMSYLPISNYYLLDTYFADYCAKVHSK